MIEWLIKFYIRNFRHYRFSGIGLQYCCYYCENYTLRIGGYCIKYHFYTQPRMICNKFKMCEKIGEW
jgi:hypothetical protein